MKRLSLSTLAIISAFAIAAVTGCNKDQQASNEQGLKQDEQTIKKSASEAKDKINEQAKAGKESVDAQVKSVEAQMEAQKARARADAANAKSEVDAQSRKIQDAAGSASARIESQTGSAQSSPTATATADSDQKQTEQVQNALKGESPEATTDATKAVQVSVSGAVVTLKGNVKSQEEKTKFEQKAKSVSGVTKVDNQLTVAQ